MLHKFGDQTKTAVSSWLAIDKMRKWQQYVVLPSVSLIQVLTSFKLADDWRPETTQREAAVTIKVLILRLNVDDFLYYTVPITAALA